MVGHNNKKSDFQLPCKLPHPPDSPDSNKHDTVAGGSVRTACNAIPPATPYRLLNPKWPTGGPKMADGVWKS